MISTGRIRVERLFIVGMCIALAFMSSFFGFAQAKGDVQLSLWTAYPELLPVYERAAADYSEMHPNVKIIISAFPLRDQEKKVAVGFVGGSVPDIIEQQLDIMLRFKEEGFTMDPPEDIANHIKDTVKASYVDLAMVDGNVAFYPFFSGNKMLFWNKAMVREAGLSGPPKTYEEFAEYAQKLTKYDESGEIIRSGLSLRIAGQGSGIATKFSVFLHLFGGQVVEEFPGGKWRAAYNNEAGYRTLKLYIDHLYKWKANDWDLKQDTEAFALEQTAMIDREAWVIGFMEQNAPHVEYETAFLPDMGDWGTLTTLVGLWVPTSSKHPEVAWDFLKHLNSPEYLQVMIYEAGWVPVSSEVDWEPVYAEYPQFEPAVEQPEGYKFWAKPIYPVADEVMSRLADRLVAAFRSSELVDNKEGMMKVLNDAANETNSILKRNNLLYEE